MQRLSGLDASFLYMETPSSYMHVAGLMVLDPATVPEGFSMENIREFYESRLHLAAPFRRRLAEIPLGIHHPLWIEDPDFDLEQHLHHIAVPPPGGPRELSALAADLVKMPLDRSRPLWECWIIEGLEGGHIAALTKVHHAAIDGVSGNEITVAMLQLGPEDEPPPPTEEWKPDRVPTDIELLAYAASSIARQPVRLAKTARRTLNSTLRVRERNRRPDVEPPPGLFNAPRTSFNVALTPHREFAFTSLSLPDVKMVKNALGVSVNDVVLGLCAGALRSYLEHVNEHPEEPLVAMVPVSVRTEQQKGKHGNQVSSMLCSLATDVDDPVERLLRIHEGTKAAKEQINIIGADALTDWVEFAAPALLGRAVRLYSRTHMADRHRPLFNVTISNVPGPPFPLYSAGARMIAHYPMGPIFDGGGLNITLMSYMDSLDFGLVACSDVIDDVWFISDALADALEELKKAVDAENTELNVETCVGCRFDGSHYSRIDARKSLRSIATRWRWAADDVDEAVLACRPEPAVWSPTEYASHAADVVGAVSYLLHLMTTRDLDPLAGLSPTDASPDDPPPSMTFADSVFRLEQNALRMDDEVAHLTPSQWERTVVLDGETVDTEWVVRHAVHDSSHHLMDIGRGIHTLGVGAPQTFGTVDGLFVSAGGVPKRVVDEAVVGYRGVDGDRQATRQHHGRVWQALCLWSAEVIDGLRAEGHSVAPGNAGENVCISGIDWSMLRPGVRIELGDVLAEVSAYAEPCTKNAGWFVDGDYGRMSHARQPGVSRVYANVLRDGVIRPGDTVTVEPG